MVGIVGGTDLARGDGPVPLVGVFEPESEAGGSVEGMFKRGNG